MHDNKANVPIVDVEIWEFKQVVENFQLGLQKVLFETR